MSITVRQASEQDIDDLVEMRAVVHDLHRAAAPTFFKHLEPADAAALLRSKLQEPETRVWIAHVGQTPAGYAASYLRERPANPVCFAQRFCELDEIVVLPGHRRRGVARSLVDHILTDTRGMGVTDVQLTTWSFNAEALAAFQSLGFRPMTVRLQHESAADPPVDLGG